MVPMINFYLDIETDNSKGYGLDPFLTKVVTIQILLPDGKVYLKKDPQDIEDIKPILEKGQVVGANIKFDAKVLEAQFGVQVKHLYDVQIAELVISGGDKTRKKGATTYKALVKQYCNVNISKDEQTGFRYGVPLTKAQKEYAFHDIKYLPEIFDKQQASIKALKLEDIIKTEMDCLPVIVWLELSGLFMDVTRLQTLETELYTKRAESLREIAEIIGHEINLNSPKQVKEALNSLGIPAENTNKKYLIQFIQYPIVRAIINFKMTEKLFNSFINKLPKKIHPMTGRLHADFRQFGARSGRMSCTNPNLQQQPNNIEIRNKSGEVVKKLAWREIYKARPGYKIVAADYNQMELRILAQASKDPTLIKAFNEGLDLHTLTAEMIYHEKIDKETEEGAKKRKAAKKVNFGIPYGVTKYGLYNQLVSDGIPATVNEAEEMIQIHRKGYPDLHKYLDTMQAQAKHTLQVRNIAGRLIKYTDPKEAVRKEYLRRQELKNKPIKTNAKPPMPLDKYRKRLYQSIGNNGKNNPIQSLGADIIKIALRGVYNKLKDGPCDHTSGRKQCYLVNVVHDEIVMEVPNELAEYTAQVLQAEMVTAGKRFINVIDCP
ncbi:MAG TPA: DNA polymerase, partial [Methanosarcina sp.]